MTTYDHVLHGCAPVPLAGYLKALGVFRLVAEQADAGTRGFWRDERFVLRTQLTEGELVQFFAEKYKPTPVIAPWNGGSGFWTKENNKSFCTIQTSTDPRLAAYKADIRICWDIKERTLSAAPKGKDKATLIAALRSTLSEEACRWLDGALVLTPDKLHFPPILGTGGNDGRLDFSNNFMHRLVDVINSPTGKSKKTLRSSLFSAPCAGLKKGPVGQYSPGAAGGVNTDTGFEAKSRVNSWDFILTIEGALAFAAAAVHRHAQDRAATLAFPFTTRTVGAGSGAVAFTDEKDARAEFWAPLWSRAAGLEETLMLMSEGRAVLDGGAVRNGLDFARAAAQLGVTRGIDSFQRYAFLMRAGQAYRAIPLGRVRVRENPRASLISDLNANGWLSKARNTVRNKNISASLGALGRRLDETLFRLAGDGSTEAVQEVLIAVGMLALAMERLPKEYKDLCPPPRLSKGWTAAAADRSHEFALARSLASIDAAAEDFRLPLRRHLGSISVDLRGDSWDDKTASKALVVWTGRDLVSDMVAVLERRLIEARRGPFATEAGRGPLHGQQTAPLAAVAAFLAGHTDNARIAALVAGLAWAQSGPESRSSTEREDALPFAFAVLKPLFAPEGVGPETGEKRLLNLLPLVRLISADRAEEAVKRAQRMARGAGLPAPFAQFNPVPSPAPPRLAAALLFPIAPKAQDRLIARAYPDFTKDEEHPHAA